MNVTVAEIQENFKAKAGGDLLSLASTASAISPETRIVLLQELERRLDSVKDQPKTIQLVHGWYTVFVQRRDIKFPDRCPSCLLSGASTAVAFNSNTDTRYRAFLRQSSKPNLASPLLR